MNDKTNKNWTTDNMPDLTGKVIIVTGANSGIGYEAAKEFARKGAQTILACRNMDKAQSALNQIWAEVPNAKVEIMQLDLASQKSIHAFAEAFKSKYNRLDVLVNNAGIMMVSYGRTEDGFERQFGTNHLGHFALTGLLFDLLKNTPNSRVVNVSSNGHRQGHMDFDNLMYEKGGYSRMGAYGRTKLANLLFTYELQRRFERGGINSIATAAHPGLTNTALADHLFGVKFLRPILGRLIQNSAMGALPTLRAAVDPTAKGGQYYGPGNPGETSGYPIVVRSNRASHNKSDARQLWLISEELTGLKFL
ncbi:MAG TPA: oxidoreductase [Anaerolineales bacterium]|nr:oxidoreductase [Anaerolineales bacterium]HSM72849.1 oxidoreductase [Anaerolineales bacterium]